MLKISQSRFIVWAVAIYILTAFLWWSKLLLKKNDDALNARIEVLRLEQQLSKTYDNETHFEQTPQYKEVVARYNRQAKMIFGEGSVLFFGLLWGVFFINRAYLKEVLFVQRQRNFLLSITHELKSPIASIQLILETFSKRKLDENQIITFSNAAQKEATRLNELVSDLLLSAKLDTDYKPVFDDVNLKNLLEEIGTKVKIRYPKTHLNIAAENLPILRGDKSGLFSVFINLVENAAKYSTDTPNIQVKSWYENNQFHFEVADNGIGIPAAERKNVFQQFYRIGSEETRKTKGTGLGLYIVNEIVKAHKGSIAIAENKPKGTIFKVSLPDLSV